MIFRSAKREFLVSRCADFAQTAALVAIFAYYFVENFAISGGWEMLALRSVDDAAMQGAIRNIHKSVMAGDVAKLFHTFDYAYGNAFWLFTSLLLFPFYLIGDAQAEIVAGRQISLLFVAGSIYFMGQIIEKICPDARRLKYPAMIAMATAPMIAIVATKLHVNAQSLFWGVLSIYYLVRHPVFVRSDAMWSAAFAGMAAGFKLTGVFVFPLVGLILLGKVWPLRLRSRIYEIALFGFVLIVVTAACLFPPLLLFPFYTDEISLAYRVFIMFRDLAVFGGNDDLLMKSVNGMSYFLGPVALGVSLLLFPVLLAFDIRKRRFISSFIFLTLFATVSCVVLTVDKDAAYVGAYILNVSLFLPFGMLGIVAVRVPEFVKLAALYLVVLSSLVCLTPLQRDVSDHFNFFKVAESEAIQNQLMAMEEIRPLVTPLELPVRILQDCDSAFPATMYQDGIFVSYILGDLKDKASWGAFDYILLNRTRYMGKPDVPPAIDGTLPLSAFSGSNLEEAIRRRLYEQGDYLGRKYRLIYDRYDSLLYKLVKKPQ